MYNAFSTQSCDSAHYSIAFVTVGREHDCSSTTVECSHAPWHSKLCFFLQLWKLSSPYFSTTDLNKNRQRA